ncbi:ASCH domain-containing protein [Dyella flagellata]|uniref:RNA-binding protein n=1 Tax=Dyella flagellata TaxID=1867833 RepID=A0ABQ5XGX5_9GAMM|nr:ASCH domain-containing protein [Dyella flagellata]GLQ90959.1 RNA-binding protein [Dyella flagellata]
MSLAFTLDEVLEKLGQLGITHQPDRVRMDGYGDSDELSQELLALIHNGKKRANASLAWSYEHDHDSLPQAGDIEIVVDHLGNASLITRIVSVDVMPYSAVTDEHALVEGEGDGSLQYWRQAHWAFFSRECERIGRKPSEAMPVVCVTFEVIAGSLGP